MVIMSWNCHFGVTESKIDLLKQLEDVDIFVIQECREQDSSLIGKDYVYKWHGDTTESRGNRERTYGVGIFANKEKYSIEKADWSEQLNDFRYVVPFNIIDKENNIEIVIVNVWTKSCDRNNKKYENYHTPLFKALEKHENFNNLQNMIIMGDFNTGSVEKSKSQEWYDKLKEKLLDYNFENCAKEDELKPTFYKGNGEWLDDHCFIKKELVKKYKLKFGEKEKWIGSSLSDHIPLFLNLE